MIPQVSELTIDTSRSIAGLRFGRARRHPELERLICAAVCNARFASLLITSPEQALALSECGKRLSIDERRMVLSIRDADDIYDFAGRLYTVVAQQASPE